MLRGFMTVSFWTLLSRVLGMLREVLLFALIGAGPILDAFFAAFRLPNMFRRFFAEGAFQCGVCTAIFKTARSGRPSNRIRQSGHGWFDLCCVNPDGLCHGVHARFGLGDREWFCWRCTV